MMMMMMMMMMMWQSLTRTIQLDFGGKSLTAALAALVAHVMLPADTSKIDHISRVFARKYYAQNANGEFNSADAVYYVVLLIIMLNTSINQTIDNTSDGALAGPMRCRQFIELAAGLNDGQVCVHCL
jgi:Sec7-like guanine-nucleotide exchange factor